MYVRFLLIAITCAAALLPARAQGWKKPPLKAQAQSGAAALDRYQRALNHVQALQQLKTGGVPVAQSMSQSRKSPQEWLALLEEFTQQNGRYPSTNNLNEKILFDGVRNAFHRLEADHPAVLRIRQLRAQYPAAPHGKSPQEWLEELEAFIEKNGRFPSSIKEHVLYNGAVGSIYRLGPEDPITQRICQLRQQYPAKPYGKSPQEWLEELEAFVAQYQRYPISSVVQERALYRGVYNTQKRLEADHPVVLRIQQIQAQYPPTHTHGKSIQKWLDELDAFIEENGYFPSAADDPKQRKLYSGIFNILHRLSPRDPIALYIRQLRQQYPSRVRKK